MLHAIHARLDSLSMIRPRSIQDISNLVDLSISPLAVQRSSVLENSTPDAQQAQRDDGLLIDDIVFVAEGVDCKTGRGGEDGGLGDEGVSG